MKQQITFEVNNNQSIEQTQWLKLSEDLEQIFTSTLNGWGVKLLKIEEIKTS